MRPQSLKPEFIDTMNRYGKWPINTGFQGWLRSPEGGGEGLRHEAYKQLKNGGPVSPRAVRALTIYFQHCLRCNQRAGCDPVEPRFCKGFVEFLSQFSAADLASSPPEILAAQISFEVELDFLAREFEGFFNLKGFSMAVEDRLCGCANESDVSEAIRWLFISCGRSLHRDNYRLPPADAISLASKHFRIDLAEFEFRAVSWWQGTPWSIVLARGTRGIAGMSIVLPLHEDVYNLIRGGKRMGFEIEANELVRPSQCFLIEGVAERPAESPSESIERSQFTLVSLIYQIAALSHAPGYSSQEPLRSLSFGTTPLNVERLEQAGYQRLNAQMPVGSVGLFEKILPRDPSVPLEHRGRNVLVGLGDQLGRMPEPPPCRRADLKE